MIEVRYRPEVDGLRAIAVAVVVLFHANLGFQGGYLGVDIFFVISGYLITSICRRDISENKFSVTAFMLRRARRLLPAATVMLLVTTLFCFFAMAPSDFVRFADSVIAQQFMFANVYFWKNTGYFDGPSDFLPLLHTWSLAVEEQFYLFYPFLLLAVRKLKKTTVFTILSGISLASLFLSQYSVIHHPSAAFFLLPTRAWELLIGGLITFFSVPTWLHSRIASLASAIALISILIFTLTYSADTQFPGLSALPICVATAIFIFVNSERQSLCATVISNRTVVALGKASYSIYLWHWPILSIYRYRYGYDLTLLESGGIILTTLILGFFSWRCIEMPFRSHSQKPALKKNLGAISLSILFISLIALAVRENKGMPWRVSLTVKKYDDAINRREKEVDLSVDEVLAKKIPVSGNSTSDKTLLLWGDSHAIAIANGLDAACKKSSIKMLQVTRSSTPPLLGIDYRAVKYGEAPLANTFNASVIDFINEKKIDLVLMTCSWEKYTEFPIFRTSLERTIDSISQEQTQIILMLDVPRFNAYPPQESLRHALRGIPIKNYGLSEREHRTANVSSSQIIYDTCQQRKNVYVLDPAQIFFDQKRILRPELNGIMLYRDGSHLSVAGGLHCEEMLSNAIDRIRKKQQAKPQ